MRGVYDEAARERRVPEPDKRPGRTAFQRDRARVLHSGAFRRLAGKTAVLPLLGRKLPVVEDDFVDGKAPRIR